MTTGISDQCSVLINVFADKCSVVIRVPQEGYSTLVTSLQKGTPPSHMVNLTQAIATDVFVDQANQSHQLALNSLSFTLNHTPKEYQASTLRYLLTFENVRETVNDVFAFYDQGELVQATPLQFLITQQIRSEDKFLHKESILALLEAGANIAHENGFYIEPTEENLDYFNHSLQRRTINPLSNADSVQKSCLDEIHLRLLSPKIAALYVQSGEIDPLAPTFRQGRFCALSEELFVPKEVRTALKEGLRKLIPKMNQEEIKSLEWLIHKKIRQEPQKQLSIESPMSSYVSLIEEDQVPWLTPALVPYCREDLHYSLLPEQIKFLRPHQLNDLLSKQFEFISDQQIVEYAECYASEPAKISSLLNRIPANRISEMTNSKAMKILREYAYEKAKLLQPYKQFHTILQ